MTRSLQDILKRTMEVIKLHEAEEQDKPPQGMNQECQRPRPKAPPRQEKPALRVVPRDESKAWHREGKNPLLEDGFTPIPVVIDDLARTMGESSLGRGLARALPLVVMDLARFTDTEHMDVVATNEGIRRRRGIGLPAVKATINLLLHMKVLRKEKPSPPRLAELRDRVPGGFGGNRRYLVWNPRSKWEIPRDEREVRAIARQWHLYQRRPIEDELEFIN